MKSGDVELGLVSALINYASQDVGPPPSLIDLMDDADIELEALYGFGTIYDVIDLAHEWLDRAILENYEAEPLLETQPRERLFDLIMARFEAMERQRTALLKLQDWFGGSIKYEARQVKRRIKTAKWLLFCAQLSDSSLQRARQAYLARLLRKAEAAWREDVDGDFSKTMAVLDEGLRKAENWNDRLSFLDR